MNTNPKTYEEHLHYNHELVKSKLWFLWNWCKTHSEATMWPSTEMKSENFAQALRRRVAIFDKTDCNNLPQGRGLAPDAFKDPKWLQFEAELLDLYNKTQDEEDALRFETDGFQLLKLSLDARAKREYQEDPAHQNTYECGILFANNPTHRDPNAKRIFFHIVNTVAPQSIFENDLIPRCLFELMDQCREDFGGDSLVTNTWLNSYPRWLKFFPQEWHDSRVLTGPVDRRPGWWYQFLNRRGAFNLKHASILWQTGEFPYPRQIAGCSFEALERHLRTL